MNIFKNMSLLAFFLGLAIFTITFTPTYSMNFHIDSFDSNINEKNHWIFGSIEATMDGEIFTPTDLIQFKLKNPKDIANMPNIQQIYGEFYDNVSGAKVATISIQGTNLIDNSMPSAVKLEWVELTLDPLTHIDFAMEIFYQKSSEAILNSSIDIILTYTPTNTPDQPPLQTQFALAYRSQIATLVRFNTTCTYPRSECVVLPYQISLIHLKQNLTQITYSIRGAVHLEIDDPDVNKLNCWVNNHAVVATLGGYKGRGTYTLVYNFKEGLDYDINCPKSAVVNGYDRQEDSVLWLTGHPALENAPIDHASQTDFFSIIYDQSNIGISSIANSVAQYNDYIYTVTFPIQQTPLPDKTLIQTGDAKISFTNTKPDYFIYYLTDQSNKVLDSQIIERKNDQFPTFSINFHNQANLDLTISVRYDPSPVQIYDDIITTIQTSFELHYDSIPFGSGDHPALHLITHAIADSAVYPNTLATEKHGYIEQVGTQQRGDFDTLFIESNLKIPINEEILKIFVNSKTAFDLTFLLPSGRSQFYLPTIQPEDEKVFICKMGLFELKAVLTYDNAGRSRPLVFSNVIANIPKTDEMPSSITCSGDNALHYPVDADTPHDDIFYDNLYVELAISKDTKLSKEFIDGYLSLIGHDPSLFDEYDYFQTHVKNHAIQLLLDHQQVSLVDDTFQNTDNLHFEKKPRALSVQNYRIRFKKSKKTFFSWAMASMFLILSALGGALIIFLIISCCFTKGDQEPLRMTHMNGVDDSTYQTLN